MKWKKKQTYVLEHYLRAAVLWDLTWQRGVSNKQISEDLEVSSSTVQSNLTGKSVLLTVNREAEILAAINKSTRGVHTPCTLQMLMDRRDRLYARILKAHGPTKVLYTFPRHPPKVTERLLRAYQIEDFLYACREFGGTVTPNVEEELWSEVFTPSFIEPDQVWRARTKNGWTRERAAEAFDMLSPGTVYHWERVNFPRRHWDTAREVYGRLLR